MKSDYNCPGDNKNHNRFPSVDACYDVSHNGLNKSNKDIEGNCNASTQYDETSSEADKQKSNSLQEKGYSYIFTIIYFLPFS